MDEVEKCTGRTGMREDSMAVSDGAFLSWASG